MAIDDLDARLIELLTREPRIEIAEASRRLGVARGTVTARLKRLMDSKIIHYFGPVIDTALIGYPVTAFARAELDPSANHADFIAYLREIPQVVEVHATTGRANFLIKLVGRSNEDFHQITELLRSGPAKAHISLQVVLESSIGTRVLPLIRVAGAELPTDTP